MPDLRRVSFCLFVAIALANLPPMLAVAAAEIASAAENLPADPQTPEARSHFDEGVAAAQTQDYEKARAAFALSFDLSPNRAALFAWAQAERLSGHCDNADPLYRRFMDLQLDASERQAAELALRRCEQVPRSPPPAPAVVEPRANRTTIPPPPAEKRITVGFLVLVGGATAATLAGLTFHGLAARNRSDAPSSATFDGYQDRLDSAHRQSQWGWIGLGTGAVLGALAGWRYHRDNASDTEGSVPHRSVAMAPMLLDHAIGASFSGTMP